MTKKTILALLLTITVLLLSGCDIQMTYYPSVKSDAKQLYYTLEYDLFPKTLNTIDHTKKIPFPMIDTEQHAYVTGVYSNMPYYRDELNAVNPEFPYFYDLEKIASSAKYQKQEKLTITYQIDSSLLNELPENAVTNTYMHSSKLKPYLTLLPDDKAAARLAASLTSALSPYEPHTIKSLYHLYEDWILNNISYAVSYKDYSQNISGSRTTAQLMQCKVGTSEDISHLLVAMFRSQGIPARIVTGLEGSLVERKSEPRKPADLKLFEDGFHTQVEVYSEGKWYLLDSSLYPALKSNVTNITLASGQKLSVYKSDPTYKRKPIMPMGYLYFNTDTQGITAPTQNEINSTTPSSVYLD